MDPRLDHETFLLPNVTSRYLLLSTTSTLEFAHITVFPCPISVKGLFPLMDKSKVNLHVKCKQIGTFGHTQNLYVRLSEAVPMRPFFRAKNGGKLRKEYPQPGE